MVKLTFLFLLLLLLIDVGYSRFIRTNSSELVSDGMDETHQSDQFLSLDRLAATVTCEPMFGFLPCTTNIWGQLFLIVVYQYLLYLGEKYISSGSDLIFQVLGTGIFGASAFQVLGSLPEAVLVLASGVSGTKEFAQGQVMVGMSILAGSTIMLLTIIWGSLVLFGKWDLSATSKQASTSTTSDVVQDTKGFSLTGSGVTTDIQTSHTARIMVLSAIPFIISQLPHLFGSSSGGRIMLIIALVISLSFIIIYCFYQVFQPWIQTRRLEYLSNKYVNKTVLWRLVSSDGKPNTQVITDLFHKIDQNNDKYVMLPELRGLILGIQFEEVGLDKDDFVVMVMKQFDTSGDARIDEKEFVRGISKWLSDQSVSNQSRRRSLLPWSSKKTGDVQDPLLNQGSKGGQSGSLTTFLKAVSLLLLGIVMLTVLAAPLIQSVQSFSRAANIPSFIVSFVVVPFVMNYREALSAIKSVRQKKQRTTSLTFSEIYSAVFMNNVVGLSIFVGIVYIRGFVWDFSAEVLVVIIISVVMGLYNSFCSTFPLWTSLVAYLLYPLSLVLLYLLTNVFGWA